MQAQTPRAGRRGWARWGFAWLHAHSDAASQRVYGARKRALLGSLTGVVLEIGPGTGANLPYYAPTVSWIGVEPNEHMHSHLRRTAARHGMPVDLRTGAAEALGLGDASVDTVVGTLVLCSVDDVATALREVKRVLRPGGAFVFIEHVAAPAGSRLRRVQALVQPLWRCCADGCHLDRDTEAAIRAAGFAEVNCERFRADVPLSLIAPHIAGSARTG